MRTEEWLPGARAGMTGVNTKVHKRTFWVMEMFYILIVVVLTQLYVFFRIHKTVHQKRVNFTICKLYLKKPDLKKEGARKAKYRTIYIVNQ